MRTASSQSILDSNWFTRLTSTMWSLAINPTHLTSSPTLVRQSSSVLQHSTCTSCGRSSGWIASSSSCLSSKSTSKEYWRYFVDLTISVFGINASNLSSLKSFRCQTIARKTWRLSSRSMARTLRPVTMLSRKTRAKSCCHLRTASNLITSSSIEALGRKTSFTICYTARKIDSTLNYCHPSRSLRQACAEVAPSSKTSMISSSRSDLVGCALKSQRSPWSTNRSSFNTYLLWFLYRLALHLVRLSNRTRQRLLQRNSNWLQMSL